MKHLLFAALLLAVPAQLATAKGRPDGNSNRSNNQNNTLVVCAFGTGMTSFTGYVGCLGAFEGNINGNNTGEIGLGGDIDEHDGNWAGNWTAVGKSDDANGGWFAGGPVMGGAQDVINFDGWLTGRFIVGLKQGNAYSLYLYDWQDQNVTALDWRGVADDQPGYSHIMLYTVNGTMCENNCTEVPEPATAKLIASGLAVLAVIARRRRNKA